MTEFKSKKLTTDKFKELLAEILDETNPDQLLAIGDVYTALSEHFNNEVIERWEWQFPEGYLEVKEEYRKIIEEEGLLEKVKACHVRQLIELAELDRETLITHLEGISVACYDDEPTELLREAAVDSIIANDITIA